MKKLLLIIGSLFVSLLINAQITLENTYNASATITRLENSGYKYYVMDVANSQCRLYNMNHSIYKTINLSVPGGQYLYDIKYVTENLFNLDSQIELSYTYYYYNEIGQYYAYETRIANESGEIMLTIPGASYADVLSTGENGSKYLAYVWDYSIFPYTVETQVYSVPGQISTTTETIPQKNELIQNIFPNPATSNIIIEYELPDGVSEGLLHIIDIHGRIIDNYKIDRTFNNLHLDIVNYPKGTYICRLQANGMASDIQKFVVQ